MSLSLDENKMFRRVFRNPRSSGAFRRNRLIL